MTRYMLNVAFFCLLSGIAMGQDTAILQDTVSNIARFAFTESLPNADRIELYTLSEVTMESKKELAMEKSPERFLLSAGGYGGNDETRIYVGVESHVTISGIDCKAVVETWRGLDFRPNGAFCHTPPYGIRFYRDDKLIFETTVCWECNNFHMPRVDPKSGTAEMQLYGFQNDSQAKKLLALLQKHLPLSKKSKTTK